MKNNRLRKILSGTMAFSLSLSLIPMNIQAAQSNEYVDPADYWIEANGRTNEFDINATTTYETFYCPVCDMQTTSLVYRVPEYTRTGESAKLRNIGYSDGTFMDESGYGDINFGTPGVDGYYTGMHWTKSVCQTCGILNTVDGFYAYSRGKNIYGLNACDHNFFKDFDNTVYEQYNSTYHTTILKKGEFCQYCKGTQSRATEKPNAFNNEYGVTETVYELPDSEYNANSKSKKKLLHTRQKPGVSPLVYSRFLIDCAVFLSLNDMGKHLPDYEEIPVELELRADIKQEYDRIQNKYRNCLNRRDGSQMKLMSKFMSILTTYPDQPYAHEPICEPRDKSVIVEPKDLSNPEEMHEKDVATLDIVKRKVANGEKVLIYTSWVKIDAQDRLTKYLTDNGYKVAVLKQNVPPEKREAWVQKRLDEDGIDVLITNPSLVETGLDLNAFTTLVYYNIGYNLFTFRQSSRRSWRINQTAPRIEVYILYYKGVMQARAIKLMASKLAAATLVEGNFTEEGLAGLADTGDMTSELAKELTKGIRDEVEDVSEMFKRMAIIKDETDEVENESDYIIIDNAEEIPTETMAETPTQTPIIEIVSVSDKIKRAMLLAKQATQERQKTSVIDYPIYAENDGQFSLLDIAS